MPRAKRGFKARVIYATDLPTPLREWMLRMVIDYPDEITIA